MNLLRVFGLWNHEILSKNHCVKGTVTMVQTSFIHVVKKPIRLYINPSNTIFSHFITFTYTVDNTLYKGKLYVDLQYRCPQKGEQIDVYYDPEKPQNYACYSFGLCANSIGW